MTATFMSRYNQTTPPPLSSRSIGSPSIPDQGRMHTGVVGGAMNQSHHDIWHGESQRFRTHGNTTNNLIHSCVRPQKSEGAISALRQRFPHPSRAVKTHDCVICLEPITTTPVSVPCGHHYDASCLISLVEASMHDETLYPPRCCGRIIPTSLFKDRLGESRYSIFMEKGVEFNTLNRVYCSEPSCSRFLGSRRKGPLPHVYTCFIPSCSTKTCEDEGNKRVHLLSQKTGWMQCPGCDQMVELRGGCFHITCVCKTQFCYLCGSPWKTCSCPRWDEHRLFSRATDTPAYLVTRNIDEEPTTDEIPEVTEVPIIEDNLQPPQTTPKPWLYRTRTIPLEASSSKSTIGGLRRHASLSSKLEFPTPPSSDPSSSSETIHVPQGSSPKFTISKRRERSSAPASFAIRETVVSRGLKAQQRRLKGPAGVAARRGEEFVTTPTVLSPTNSARLDALDEQIDRLLRTVDHYGCRHDAWTRQEGRHLCESCNRSGDSISVSVFFSRPQIISDLFDDSILL
ncbi:hypothetical protein C8Q75DRAFT_803303 [Abortiporus biennis]|nr:hypothetical protein C8Q75DRAFT_803303 [Abortiporus biennis]